MNAIFISKDRTMYFIFCRIRTSGITHTYQKYYYLFPIIYISDMILRICNNIYGIQQHIMFVFPRTTDSALLRTTRTTTGSETRLQVCRCKNKTAVTLCHLYFKTHTYSYKDIKRKMLEVE